VAVGELDACGEVTAVEAGEKPADEGGWLVTVDETTGDQSMMGGAREVIKVDVRGPRGESLVFPRDGVVSPRNSSGSIGESQGLKGILAREADPFGGEPVELHVKVWGTI